MATFRNDFGEDRVVPTLGYVLVAAGQEVTVPEDQAEHWIAGGWTRTDTPPAPVAAPAAAKPAAAPAAPAAVPAPSAPAESEATQ